MKKLNSLILTTCVLFGSGLAWKTLPAFSATPSADVRIKGAVKAEGDVAPEALVQKLNLTAEQKQKAFKIFVDSNKKIAQYLTPEQRKKLEAGLKAKQGFGTILQSLNLSVDQKKKIGAVLLERRNQFVGILTADQKKKFEALAPIKK
jgi:Spy/CpxP family protein refolding chaperone